MLLSLESLRTFIHLLIANSLIYSAFAGILHPKDTFPINPSVANKDQYSDYTFTFMPDTTIPVGGQLQVQFPTQYLKGLGIPLAPTCSITCSLSGLVVTFTFSSPVTAGTQYALTIQQVLNPGKKGGTGNFQLTTYSGQNQLDQNLVFGVIGISDVAGVLYSTIVYIASGQSSYAGDASQYVFKFKTPNNVAAGSYFRLLVLDNDINITASPYCAPYTVNGFTMSGPLTCNYASNQITVTGLSGAIPAGTEAAILVNVTNPISSQLTDTFGISILNGGTNLIAEQALLIPGLTILPGRITNIALTPVVATVTQSRRKIQDYRLSFLLKNGLSAGNVITLSFPASINVGASQFNYIVSGLEDISEISTVGMNLDGNNVLWITNFKSFTVPSLITIQLRLTNPDNLGASTPIQIASYNDYTQVIMIDQDTTQAYTTIANVPSGNTHYITTSTVPTNTLIATLEFNLFPTIALNAGGKVDFKFPSSFTVSAPGSASVCQVLPYGGSYASSTSCSLSSNVLTVTLGSSFPITGVSNIKFSSLVTPPTSNGTFLIDVTTYASGSTISESWTDSLTTSPATMSTIQTSLSTKQTTQSILTFTFTPTLAVPAGVVQTTAAMTKGFLEFEFTNTLSNLGFAGAAARTQIPCTGVTNLNPISGSIACYLYPGTPSAIIRVDGFTSIAAGVTATIKFPQFTNPQSNYNVKIKTISLTNRVRTELNSVSVAFTTTLYTAPGDTGTTSSVALNSTVVSTVTTLTFMPGNTATLSGGSILIQLPFYDVGWVTSAGVTCQVGGTATACNYFVGADWIEIPISGSYAPGTQLKVIGLIVPRYAMNGLAPIFRFITTAGAETSYRTSVTMPTLTLPLFVTATMAVDKTGAGATNCNYKITISPTYQLPAGSTIRLTVPSGYNFIASNPTPQVILTSGLTAIPGMSLKYTLGISTLDIDNYQAVNYGTTVTFNITGVKNPTGLSVSNPWKIEVYYGIYQMVYHEYFGSFIFSVAPTYNYISFTSITAFPANTNQYATYTFTFTPASYIPIGGILTLTFPSSSFAVLPTPPICIVSGGITAFSTCTLSGNTYSVQLASAFSTGVVTFQLLNVWNPSPGTTDGFILQTYFDSLLLDTTDTSSLVGRTVTITSAATSISMTNLYFTPQNEGEPATYTFSFVPTDPLTSTMSIRIKFPAVYDDYLGVAVTCDATGITGDISCSVSSKAVTLTGFSAYTPSTYNPITINVYGVTNPNSVTGYDTGQFSISTLTTGSFSYLDNTNTAGALQTTAAPGWALLTDITPSSLYCRITTAYSFTFTNFASLPSTAAQGAILVLYPTQFDIPDGPVSCDTANTNFGSNMVCSVSKNTVSISGHTSNFGGGLTFNLRAITNPITSGITDEIVLKTFDGAGSKILERSFRNLDTFAFSYSFPGPLIQVNSDLPVNVVRGTQTNDILITVSYASTLNLTLIPTVSGFSVIPFAVTLNIGEVQAKFRVSVPENYPAGTYYIKWSTQGDTVPPYYTPIKKTPVVVTPSTGIPVVLDLPLGIPVSGNSLITSISIATGPDVGLTVNFDFQSVYTGVTLDSTTVSFSAGQTQAYYTVYCSSDCTSGLSGNLVVTLTGTNLAVYTLPVAIIPFTVIAADTTAPAVPGVVVNAIALNTASLVITASEISMAYYMIALDKTASPPFKEVRNGGPAPYLSTQSVYGSILISATLIATVPLTDLVAETPYIVYVYLEDRGKNPSPIASTTFVTQNRPDATAFSIRFFESSLTAAQVQVAINSVAFVLSLPSWKVQQKIYPVRRLLSNELDSKTFLQTRNLTQRILSTTTIDLQIIASPESSIYPTPNTLATMLNTKGSALLSLMQSYDTTYTITPVDFVRYIPAFSPSPTGLQTDWQSATFSAGLNNYGWVFAVCVPMEGDPGTPTPLQIKMGFNAQNVQVPNGKVEISTIGQAFTLNVTGLEQLTKYNTYVIGGSAHPGYPDLMDISGVIQIQISTIAAPIVDTNVTVSATRIEVYGIGFVGLISLLIFG